MNPLCPYKERLKLNYFLLERCAFRTKVELCNAWYMKKSELDRGQHSPNKLALNSS
jgi:hypothetical protein